jgi:hypothetical protein
MAKLHAKERNALPAKDFAIPSERKYPIENRSHAANAKSRASGKPEQGQVDAAVARKYPGMGQANPEHAKRLAHALRGGK